jgi:hypothetical protein
MTSCVEALPLSLCHILDRFSGPIYLLVLFLVVFGVPRLFGFTMLSVIKTVAEEMVGLLARQWNIRSVNALAIIGVIIVSVVVVLLVRMGSLAQQQSVSGPADNSTAIIASIALIALVFVSVFSLAALKATEDKK